MKALLQALPVDLLQSMWPDLFTNNPALVRTMLHKECGRQLDQLKSQYEAEGLHAAESYVDKATWERRFLNSRERVNRIKERCPLMWGCAHHWAESTMYAEKRRKIVQELDGMIVEWKPSRGSDDLMLTGRMKSGEAS
jgi:hypothetical protein